MKSTGQAASDTAIYIRGMGHYFPETVLDNDFFNELDIGSDAAWIEDRVGIRQRRSVLTRDEILKLRRGELDRAELLRADRITSIADMLPSAWEMAKGRAGEGAPESSIDLVLAGTSIPDWDIPANACSVAAKLGINTTSFDANSACSTFVVNLHVARSLIATGAHCKVAIFNADRYTTRVDYSDRSSCVLFGDSATACLMESGPVKGKRLRLIDTVVHSDPSNFDQVRLSDGGVFWQNGKVVQKFAVTRTVEVALEVLERNGLKPTDLSYLICHQANLRMLSSVTKRMELRDEQHLYNVDLFGNQGATGAPSTLSQNWDKLKDGDLIVVSVVGSGLTWGAALLRCEN